jgi:hypothetical protein
MLRIAHGLPSSQLRDPPASRLTESQCPGEAARHRRATSPGDGPLRSSSGTPRVASEPCKTHTRAHRSQGTSGSQARRCEHRLLNFRDASALLNFSKHDSLPFSIKTPAPLLATLRASSARQAHLRQIDHQIARIPSSGDSILKDHARGCLTPPDAQPKYLKSLFQIQANKAP